MILHDYFKNDRLDYVQANGHVNHYQFRKKCFDTHRSIPARIEYGKDKDGNLITIGYYKLY